MIAMMHCSHVWLPRKPLALTAWNRLHEPIVNSLLGCRKVHRRDLFLRFVSYAAKYIIQTNWRRCYLWLTMVEFMVGRAMFELG